ncbi:MAG: penicillin-binding transpeptidase domain-containing protein, partial [Thermoguttaceae bacterium]
GTDMTVAEELDHHVMAEDIPLAVVARIESRPDEYPGVKIVERTRRTYPSDSRAAHVLGHLGPIAKEELARRKEEGYHPDDFVGRTGIERQYETVLRGLRGMAVELTNRSGRVLSAYRQEEPGIGRDLILTIDPQLQRAAESLLDSALDLRTVRFEHPEPAGGAIVVMDVRTGALRAVASAPRFDPNLFVVGGAGKLLDDKTRPLFDRAVRMAIPPGSVFKAITAVALLEAAEFDPPDFDPDAPFFCQGYLHEPDRQRCAIYRRHGVGHDDVTLSDALAVSCNVYFFDHAGRLGPEPLADWARRFGFGQRTGIDLPSEAAAVVPDPTNGWRPGDTQSLAIGQGSLTATPMQVVRMIGAVANGGRLVTPHVVSRLGLAEGADSAEPIRIPPPRPIAGLHAETLAAVREGLQRVVADPIGTAHGTVHLESIAIAGKTGTAETGGGRADHAWFAGYAPAEHPRLAIVVVLEHSGNAATAAGPIVKALVGQMQKLGLL